MADPSNQAQSATPEPRSETVRRIRRGFGITQAQLAKAMGTSAKAIQSYEQGWRKVPTRALIQMFVLLAIHRRRKLDPVPCWEIRQCPPEARAKCPSHTIGDGQFCWFVSAGAGACRCTPGSAASDGEDRLLPCMDCEVIRRLLRDTPAEAFAAPEPPVQKPL